MKRLFTSALLTFAVVPFLMATPVPKHSQDSSQTTTSKKKGHKKHHKKKKHKKQ
ncbi:MAG TPA: hypothetical protein VF283_14575 [Bryobacteraceae bacterium]